MKVKVIQLDIVWEDVQANIDRVDQLILGWKGDLMVLPEMWSTGFSMNATAVSENMQGPAVLAMLRWSEHTGALVMGSLAIEDNGRHVNRCIMAFPNGDMKHYDKRHLFSYAKEDKNYKSGEETITVSWKDWTILPQICYDLRFPESVRYQESRPYQLLVYMANWPARRSFAWKHLLIARAIENQSYVIGVNRVGQDGNGIYYNGGSAVLDFSGQALLPHIDIELAPEIDLVLENCLQFRKKFPFLADRDIK